MIFLEKEYLYFGSYPQSEVLDDSIINNLNKLVSEDNWIDFNYYDNGNGWLPIGDYSNSFTGTYNGNGYSIKGMNINRTSYSQTVKRLFILAAVLLVICIAGFITLGILSTLSPAAPNDTDTDTDAPSNTGKSIFNESF